MRGKERWIFLFRKKKFLISLMENKVLMFFNVNVMSKVMCSEDYMNRIVKSLRVVIMF